MIPVSNIRFSKIQNKRNQHDISYLTFNNNSIYFNLTHLKCPFGITKFNNNIEKYSLNISIDKIINHDLYKSLINIDDWVNDNFIENRNWLEKLNIDINSTKKDIQSYAKTIVSENQNYPPYINLKLIFDNDGKFFCDIFESKNNKLTKLNYIQDIQHLLNKKDLYISGKIIISNVWIMDKNYGITIKPKVLRFY